MSKIILTGDSGNWKRQIAAARRKEQQTMPDDPGLNDGLEAVTPEPDHVFSWTDPELAETLTRVLLVEDAEAAHVRLNRAVGDVTMVVLRLRTKTIEGDRSDIAIAFTPHEAATVANVLNRLAARSDPIERRN